MKHVSHRRTSPALLPLIGSATLLIGLAACSDADDGSANSARETETGTDEPLSCNTANAAQSDNADIETMREAMVAFRGSLSESLREQATSCLDDERFTLWHNTPAANGNRDGIVYGDLDATQLAAFQDLLQLFLSADGYQKVYEVTFLAEEFLSGINPDVWDNDYYSIDMFGDPTGSGSWGFQLDGHHCAINFLVDGGQVSIVPAFLGGEPVTETHEGTSFDIFRDERDLALALYDGFSVDETAAAVSSGSSATMEVGPPSANGVPDPFAGDTDYSGFATGLKYSDMSADTQSRLTGLMQEYVYNMQSSFADQWWSDILANIDDTYFVWLDDVETPNATTQFYYRIYNPYLWIEYNMEAPVGGGLDAWNHVHTITRIPNGPATDAGGDYGIFAQLVNDGGPKTLFEHYAQAAHHQPGPRRFDGAVAIGSARTEPHGHDHTSESSSNHAHSHE